MRRIRGATGHPDAETGQPARIRCMHPEFHYVAEI